MSLQENDDGRFGVELETGIPFTPEALSELLGENFYVKPTRQGNFQVNIRHIRDMSDDDKITLLYEGRRLLREQGFEVTAKLTYRNTATQMFTNWPCLWVDQPVTHPLNPLHDLDQMTERLFLSLERNGIEVPQDVKDRMVVKPAEMKMREVAPSEEDFERAGSIRRRQHDIAKGTGSRKTQNPMERGPTLNQPSPGVGGYEDPWADTY